MSDQKTEKKSKITRSPGDNFGGKPGPGRPKGLKNKKTLLSVEQTLANLGFNPIEKLIQLYPDLTPNGKVAALELLMKYSYTPPKDTASDGTSIQITYTQAE